MYAEGEALVWKDEQMEGGGCKWGIKQGVGAKEVVGLVWCCDS